MQDLTSAELQNIDGGSWSDYLEGCAVALAVLAAPLEMPLLAIAVGVTLFAK